MPNRKPFVGEIFTEKSPTEPEIEFRIKRCGVAENIERQDMSSKVRYIVDGEDGQVATERDYPMGTRQIDTIALALVGWNITDDDKPVAISKDNIVAYLDPEEQQFLYDAVIEHNPMWQTGGQAARKNS